jgi:hypothetical protein
MKKGESRRMPASRKRHTENPKLQALAYDDAVRDILASDGAFHLADETDRDAAWEWDGVRWKRVRLVDEPLHEEDVPIFEVDMASVA